MRIDINLASQPYEDARQFWMRWGTALGALGLLTLVLLGLVITGWIDARRDRAAISQKKAMIADRERLEAEAQKTLNLPENRTTKDESQYLNELIARKAFSWTRGLENLEKVMPPRLHVVSITPQLSEDNELALKMTVAGDSRDRAIELARRMEDSGRFVQVLTPRATHVESQTGDTEQVEITAVYIPQAFTAEATNEPTTNSPKPKSPAQGKSTVPSAKKGTKH